jgi:two-component system, OmpR family, phosphate regulon sensor histidine kinase PhoR
MDWQLILYIGVLGFAMLICLCIAAIGLWHRERGDGSTLRMMMLAVAAWSFFYMLEASAADLAVKVRWLQLAHIGALSAGPLFLRLTLNVTRESQRWRGVLPWLVWSVPVISLILVLTNNEHGLVWHSFAFAPSNPAVLIYGRGPWFWLMAVHSYAVLLGAAIVLITAAVRYRSTRVHSGDPQQVLLALCAAALPWILSALYLFRAGLLGNREWTPAGFALTGMLLLWNIEKLQFIDLLPRARDGVVVSMKDAAIVVDPHGYIADMNPAAERLLGSSDLVGTKARLAFADWLGTPAPEGRGEPDVYGAAAVRDFADFLPPQGELVTENGTLEWRLTPLETGAEPGQIIILHDVTIRKQAEAALQSLNATLEFRVTERTAQILAEKERSDAILHSISDGILMTDRDLYILYVNPTFSLLLGYDAEEALGCPVAEFLGDEADALLRQARTCGKTSKGELLLAHKDGRAIDVAMNISPVHSHDGVTGYVCTLRDITNIKSLERARKSFIDNISHQLRTPVTNLRLYAHLMSLGELSEQSRSYLAVMNDQTAWLQHLIEDVLEMTSLDSGQAIAAWKSVSPAMVIDHIATRYQSPAERTGLRLVVQAPPADLPTVRGDQMRLMQAMSEIAENAIRFTPPGGLITLQVRTVEDENGREWVTLSIADTGPGIPREEQPRIFDRFFRGALTEPGHLSGTGLGLSIAEAIVRAHGGRITLQTDPDGTTFSVWLPVPTLAVPLPEQSGPA